MYNLAQDPGETTNVVDKEPETASGFAAAWGPWRKTLRSRLHEADHRRWTRRRAMSSVRSATPAAASSRRLSPWTHGGGPKDFLPAYLHCIHAKSQLIDGFSKDAEKKALAVVATRPDLIFPRKTLIEIALDEHRLADAVRHSEKIIAVLEGFKDPAKRPPGASQKLAIAHYNIGLTKQQAGNLKDAIERYREALRNNPDYAEADVNLGLALEATGKAAKAAPHYEEALRIKPNYPDAHLNLGNVLQQSGKFAEAIDHYRQALQVQPNYTVVHVNLGNALCQSGKFAEAIEHYQEALRIEPELAKTNPNLKPALAAAEEALAVQEAKAAVKRCQKVLRDKPDDPAANNDMGNLLRLAGKYPEAIQHYRQALKGKPDAAIHYNLAVALGQQGDIAEAAAEYAEAMRLKPDSIGAVNNLAWIRATSQEAGLRDGAEAVRLAQRACELAGRREPGTLGTLAAACAEAGKFPAAVAAEEEALELAKTAKQAALAKAIQSRLDLYRAGKPYRDPSLKPRHKP